MTEQQRRFCEYLIEQEGKDQYKAAIRAGYSEKSAPSQSSALMKNPKVLEYYESLKSRISKDLRDRFLFDALWARKVMRDILENPTSENRDKITTAKDFLDRAGFKPEEKVEVKAPVRLVVRYDYGND